MTRTFRIRRHALLGVVAAVLSAAQVTRAAFPGSDWWQYATPKEAGYDAEALDTIRQDAEESGSAAVFVVQDGHVVVAWGDVDRRFKCHSVRKSLLSALIGIHVDAGQIDMNKTLAELGIDDVEPLSEQEKQARVLDLILARSGVYHPAAKEPPGMKRNRPARGSHPPGEHFFYNNWDFNTLGVIFEQETGKKIFEEFGARIAKPIGMQDYRVEDGSYQLEPSYSNHSAYAFRMSARDLARFGWLFANGGQWNGKQVIPAAWVKESTTKHSDVRGLGYGYMWWVWPKGVIADRFPNHARHDSFAARGTGGQQVLVIPEIAFVMVHRGDTDAKMFGPRLSVTSIAERILAARTGEPVADPKLEPVEPVPFATAVPPPPERTAIDVDPADLMQYVGVYENPPQMHIRLHIHDGRLFGDARGLGEAELLCEGKDRFFLEVAPSLFVFQRDDAGQVTGASMTLYGETQKLTKTKRHDRVKGIEGSEEERQRAQSTLRRKEP
jgi:CubicO group peptidase (beta-lactamase class C family)